MNGRAETKRVGKCLKVANRYKELEFMLDYVLKLQWILIRMIVFNYKTAFKKEIKKDVKQFFILWTHLN